MGPRCDKSTGLKKRPWTAEEDERLLHYIHKHGHGKWRTVPNNAGLQRRGKSCRLRRTNYLRPDIKTGRFSVEEEDTIIRLHCVLGNKWSLIASRLPGRTDNEIKNYRNTHIRKRLLKWGIDPVTHNLRLDILQLCSFLNSSSPCISPQLNIQSLLDIQNVMNINVPNLQNHPEFMHDDNQVINFPQVQCQYYQPFQEFPAGTSSAASNVSSLNTLLTQSHMEQLSQGFNLSSKNYAPSLCPNINSNDRQPTYMGQSLACPTGTGSIDENPSGVELLWADIQNQMFQFNNIHAEKFEFGSVISTPSAGTSHLNSSTTHVNGSSSEDEEDTFCNTIMFDTPYDDFGF